MREQCPGSICGGIERGRPGPGPGTRRPPWRGLARPQPEPRPRRAPASPRSIKSRASCRASPASPILAFSSQASACQVRSSVAHAFVTNSLPSSRARSSSPFDNQSPATCRSLEQSPVPVHDLRLSPPSPRPAVSSRSRARSGSPNPDATVPSRVSDKCRGKSPNGRSGGETKPSSGLRAGEIHRQTCIQAAQQLHSGLRFGLRSARSGRCPRGSSHSAAPHSPSRMRLQQPMYSQRRRALE